MVEGFDIVKRRLRHNTYIGLFDLCEILYIIRQHSRNDGQMPQI